MQSTSSKLNYEEFLTLLDNIPISKKDRVLLKSKAKYNYDFIDFMVRKLNTTRLVVDSIVEININQRLKKLLLEKENELDSEDDIFELSRIVISQYVKEQGFKAYEELASFTIDTLRVFNKLNQ